MKNLKAQIAATSYSELGILVTKQSSWLRNRYVNLYEGTLKIISQIETNYNGETQPFFNNIVYIRTF